MKKNTARSRPDWDAIKRDYGTAKYTFRELETKYGIKYSSIARKCKKDGWTQDLAKAIKQATAEKLTQHLVNKEANKEAQNVNNAINAAAEIGKNVILKHRTDIEATRTVAADLLLELQETKMLLDHKELLAQVLAGSGASPRDESEARALVKRALDINTRIAGVKTLSETFTKLQASERIAFSLDDKEEKEKQQADAALKIDLTLTPSEAYKTLLG